MPAAEAPHPPKQGLKPAWTALAHSVLASRSASSTKTRIETSIPAFCRASTRRGRSASSTKTRIETVVLPPKAVARRAEAPHPPKQGLKLLTKAETTVIPPAAEAPHPPKQGLKPEWREEYWWAKDQAEAPHPPKQGLKHPIHVLFEDHELMPKRLIHQNKD